MRRSWLTRGRRPWKKSTMVKKLTVLWTRVYSVNCNINFYCDLIPNQICIIWIKLYRKLCLFNNVFFRYSQSQYPSYITNVLYILYLNLSSVFPTLRNIHISLINQISFQILPYNCVISYSFYIFCLLCLSPWVRSVILVNKKFPILPTLQIIHLHSSKFRKIVLYFSLTYIKLQNSNMFSPAYT